MIIFKTKKMKKIFLLILLISYSGMIQSQESNTFSLVKTRTTQVKIPGNWEQLNTAEDSGQTYLKNKEGIIIAVAQNPKKAYSFFKSEKTNFENVKLFYTWDSDFMKESKFKTEKLKEDAKSEFIVWKFNDNKLDNLFLFGSIKDNFINLLIYTDIWPEEQKIAFLEKVYLLNK